MPLGPRNLRISCDAEGLTQFGGVALLHAFFRGLGLRSRLCRAVRFPLRNNEYTLSECVEALLYPLILGLGRVETSEPLRRNGVFQYLAGLRSYPHPTTLRRFLQRFGALGRDKFVTLHDQWRRAMLVRPRRSRRAILDLDTTVLTVYGRQEKSAVGFNPKKRGRRSYMAFLCFEGQSRDVLCGSYHPGNTHPSSVFEPLLTEAFAKVHIYTHRVVVRADSAFFDHEIIESIEAQKAFYAIATRVTRPMQERLGGLRYRRVSRGVSAGEFRYCPQGWKFPRRFVVIRRPIPEEPSAQLTLFKMGRYTYQVFVTNLTLKPLNLWRFYNGRATAELIIRELKDAYALGKIPTHDFAANEVFFQVELLGYNLLNWFKRLCVPAHWQRATLQRLRQRLLVVPAQLVRPGGVPTLRISRASVQTEDIEAILKRIHKLRPLTNGARDSSCSSRKRSATQTRPRKKG